MTAPSASASSGALSRALAAATRANGTRSGAGILSEANHRLAPAARAARKGAASGEPTAGAARVDREGTKGEDDRLHGVGRWRSAHGRSEGMERERARTESVDGAERCRKIGGARLSALAASFPSNYIAWTWHSIRNRFSGSTMKLIFLNRIVSSCGRRVSR